ncbi:MAG: hypothetical protein CR994_02635 [Maribacter sp.]|nr:MAG: hypothetical protein CR994_02635 [Maribacter sp.]
MNKLNITEISKKQYKIPAVSPNVRIAMVNEITYRTAPKILAALGFACSHFSMANLLLKTAFFEVWYKQKVPQNIVKSMGNIIFYIKQTTQENLNPMLFPKFIIIKTTPNREHIICWIPNSLSLDKTLNKP